MDIEALKVLLADYIPEHLPYTNGRSKNDGSLGGIVHVYDVPLVPILRCLKAVPELHQESLPQPLSAFTQMMTQFPRLRASGYLVLPSRPDTRLTLDTLIIPERVLEAVLRYQQQHTIFTHSAFPVWREAEHCWSLYWD